VTTAVVLNSCFGDLPHKFGVRGKRGADGRYRLVNPVLRQNRFDADHSRGQFLSW
jgi:hypothetical protein